MLMNNKTYFTWKEAAVASCNTQAAKERVAEMFEANNIIGDGSDFNISYLFDALCNLDTATWYDDNVYITELVKRLFVKSLEPSTWFIAKEGLLLPWSEEQVELTKDDVQTKWFRIINKIRETKDEYIAKIEAIAELDLDNKAKTTTRFNDTPQNAGNFEDLDHNTNITISEQELPKIQNILLYNDSVKDIYDDWIRLFEKFYLRG